MSETPLGQPARDEELTGYFYAVGSYFLWGFLPIYFLFLHSVPADQLVAQRIVWSVVTVGLVFAVAGRMKEVRAVFAQPRILIRLALSACVIAGNWLVFVWAIEVNRVLEISFGYFINPLVSVALGTVLLGEKLSVMQRYAVLIALVAIALQAWGLGAFPWISLMLAFSFGFYGFLRKTVDVGAAPGLLAETVILMPLALAYLVWHETQGTLALGDTTLTTVLVAVSGLATAIPLILFASGVRRLPLSTIGILQYLAPSIQFLLALTVFGEPLDWMRFASFALIWLSLAVFTRDLVRKRAATLEARRGAQP